MASFADFVLLRALPSYGGAEVLRARRVRDGGALDAALHLALFGAQSARDALKEDRLLDVAEASATLTHEAVARIVEVGRADGALYAAAEPAEGVDLATLLEHERRRRAVPDARFVVAVAFSLARIVQDLHDRGDVWAARAPGLAGLFPAGLRADAIVLRKDGALIVRVLAGAADDKNAPTAFRAPELAGGESTASSDVFTVIQVLRALLSSDATAQAPPRLPDRGGALPTLLVGALQRRPEDRPMLDAVVTTLRDTFADNAPNQSPAGVIQNALRREYRSLLLEEVAKDDVAPAAIADIEARRSAIAATRTVLFPHVRRRAPPAAADSQEEPRTVAIPRFKPHASDAVDRVFTQEGDTSEGNAASSIMVTTSLPSVEISEASDEPAAAVGAPAAASAAAPDQAAAAGAPPRSDARSILDLAAETINDSADKTQKLVRNALLDSGKDLLSSEGSSPWMSAIEVSATGAPLPEPVTGSAERGGASGGGSGDAPATVAAEPAFAAPVFADSDLEHSDTVEMQQRSAPIPRDVSFASGSGEDKKPAPPPAPRKR